MLILIQELTLLIHYPKAWNYFPLVAHQMSSVLCWDTFCWGVQLLGVFSAGCVRVVTGHGNETVRVEEAHSAHLKSGHDQVHGQLAHITDSHGRLEIKKKEHYPHFIFKTMLSDSCDVTSQTISI